MSETVQVPEIVGNGACVASETPPSNGGLIVRSLETTRGTFRLGPISFELEGGAYLTLLGPSGCGKTSLLKVLNGLYPARKGTVILKGRDITHLPPEKRRIGYVPQTSELFPHLNVRDNILFGTRYADSSGKELNDRYEKVVELLALEPLLGRRVNGLSGGESRKVALARSLAVNPELLLLDEPLSMLDPNSRADVLNGIRRLHREIKCITIHVTHDREEAMAIRGSCLLMRSGLTEQTGTVDDVFGAPATPFAVNFLKGGYLAAAEVKDG